MNNSKIRKRPAKIFLIYSLFTFFLYCFGAYNYPRNNQLLLILFLSICNFAMYFGFVNGTQKSWTLDENAPVFPLKKWMTVLFWISLITIVPKFYIFTRISVTNISEIIRKISTFTSSAQDLYTEHHNITRVSGIWQYINYLVVLSSPFTWIYYVLSMLFWKKLSFWKKIGTIFIWGLTILQYIVTGTNVGIVEFIGLFATCQIISGLSTSRTDKKRKILKFTLNGEPLRFRSKKILFTIGAIIIAILIFSTVMNSRIGNSYTKSLGFGSFLGTYSESGINKLLPENIKPIYAYITRYFAGGYRGLALSFDVPFKCSFGLGYSSFLLNNAGTFSSELWDRTYNMQIFYYTGYPYDASWHTAFLWIANDVSLFGVPIVLLVLMYFFGKAWGRYLDTGNLGSFLLFMIYVKMMFFISANNQVFRSFDTLVVFWSMLFFSGRTGRWNWRMEIEKI